MPPDTKPPDPGVANPREPPKDPASSLPEPMSGITTDREDVESDGEPKVEVEDVYGSTPVHPFSDPRVAEYWRGVDEKADYEGRHRFDPHFEWTAEEELQLRRKVDWRIITWAWAMFFALDLNRRSGNQAISDDMLPELGMDTNDFNTGQTILLVSFLSAELPSGLISKKLGPDRWIPTLIVAWSILAACQAALTSRAGYYAIRCLLGLCMGGFIPDLVLYITYWYRKRELPIRLSWFWTVLSTCQVVGAFLAAGLLQMRGLSGLSGWRFLFLIEGLFTLLIGLASWTMMPASPCQTAGRGRGKGWFTEREEYILVNRLLRDDPSKGDMNNRQAVTPKLLWKCLKDYDLWPLYLIGLTVYIPPSPIQQYLTFIIREMGFTPMQANLLSIPAFFMFGVNLLIISRVSEWVKERSFVSLTSQIWMLPLFIALVLIPESSSHWVRYALLSLVLAYPYCHAIVVAWNSRNSNSVRARAVSAALYNMFVQTGNIVSANIYREDDRPYCMHTNYPDPKHN